MNALALNVAAAERLAPPAVSLKGVARAFDDVVVLKSVSLDIREGEFFSLLGPSGCGKTTLLRIIAGFESMTSGELLIAGENAADTPAFGRKTNMVFQHGALFPHLTAAQNVAFGLEMKRMRPADIRPKVARALEMVRLPGFGDRRIDQLSGGQRQRIALARALVNEPKVLLLDEPLSALDLHLRLQMQEELRRLQRETGATFVFVTHDQGEAITMSDRMAVMNGGEILQVGAPREIYERPVRSFVAEFMGHSNLLRGVVASASGDMADVVCDGIRIAGWCGRRLAAGDEVLVSLRYEKLRLSPKASGEGTLGGQVVDEVYMGPTVRRKVALANGLVLTSETSNAAADFNVGVGSTVTLDWARGAATVLKD